MPQTYIADEAGGASAPDDDILLVGCVESSVMISSPEDGSELSGVVSITGTADIGNFAFYKYEYGLFLEDLSGAPSLPAQNR